MQVLCWECWGLGGPSHAQVLCWGCWKVGVQAMHRVVLSGACASLKRCVHACAAWPEYRGLGQGMVNRGGMGESQMALTKDDAEETDCRISQQGTVPVVHGQCQTSAWVQCVQIAQASVVLCKLRCVLESCKAVGAGSGCLGTQGGPNECTPLQTCGQSMLLVLQTWPCGLLLFAALGRS